MIVVFSIGANSVELLRLMLASVRRLDDMDYFQERKGYSLLVYAGHWRYFGKCGAGVA